ncbi:hypothetical protein BGZ98_008409 [Dissophora globulifera]|nr:hypothetical protein BGZ98_008409 [Dissophora globulifera]
MTETSGLQPTQHSKSNPDGSITIRDKVDGSLHTFDAVTDGTKRVQCKECSAKFGKKQATRHYDLHQDRKSAKVNATAGPSTAAGCTDHGQDPRSTTRPLDEEVDGEQRSKKPRTLLRTSTNAQGETKEGLIQALCGDLTVEMMLTTAKCARLLPYVLRGPSVMTASFMSRETAEQIRGILPEGHSLSLYPVCNSNDVSNHPTVPYGYEDAMNKDHIEVMTKGGTPGMERLTGAIVATGDKQIKIICTEHYLRDRTQDPHAESIKTHHTSVPDDQSTSQYSKMLKIATIPDKFNNPHLVIGTSAGNYLVTSSEEDDHAYVGPGRCGQFKVSEHTRLLISQERQDQSLLDNTVFGLAQVRTGFGHPATYSTRRAIMEKQNDPKTMPVTIFTLHHWKVQGAKVFYQLHVRFLEKCPDGIILKISDIDDSPPGGKIAECLTELSNLFIDNELNVTRTPMAEDILQGLANLFSKIISDKNRVVADNIEKRKKAKASTC